jgi:hypothetical protein
MSFGCLFTADLDNFPVLQSGALVITDLNNNTIISLPGLFVTTYIVQVRQQAHELSSACMLFAGTARQGAKEALGNSTSRSATKKMKCTATPWWPLTRCQF